MKKLKILRTHKLIRHISFCYKGTTLANYFPLALVLLGYVLVSLRLFVTKKKLINLKLQNLAVSLNCFSGEITGFWENFLENKYRVGSIGAGNRCILDVGGNAGFFSMSQILQYEDKLSLYTFEPDPEVFVRMSRHIEQCNLSKNARLHPLNIALGSQNGTVKFFRNESCLSRVATQEDDRSRCIEVPMETLDNIVASQRIEHIDLIKMDVEGFELEVIKGALTRALPMSDRVVMQYHENRLREVTELLQKQGFQPVWQNDEKSVAMFEKADRKG